MSLKEEIKPYIDGNGLIAPNMVGPNPGRASDNGTMFSSEYIIMLERNGESTMSDRIGYLDVIERCIGKDGELHRAPGDDSPDEIDDHLGVLAGYAEFKLPPPFKLPFRLMRFPQLTYATWVNKGVPSLLIFPLAIYNALCIAVSCVGVDKDHDGDARRLNWLLWQATKRKSLLARIAGAFWHWKEARKFGTKEVMKYVASHLYYQMGHPFGKFWID